MRAEAVSRITRLYPLLSGCGTLANHRFVTALAGNPTYDAWAKVKGGKLFVALDDYVGRSAFYVGDLDRKVSAIVDRFVKPGDTVLDIGANIGLVTLHLSERVGRKGTVHAFEPNPAIAKRLVASLAASKAHNVRVHQVALGDAPATLRLSIPAGNAGAASLVPDRVCEADSVEVPVRRLDDFELGSIAFIKIDVEGFEENVLRGFAKTLVTNPPRAILFEQNEAAGAPIPLLQKAGYRVCGVAKSLFRLDLRPVSAWTPKFNDYLAVQ